MNTDLTAGTLCEHLSIKAVFSSRLRTMEPITYYPGQLQATAVTGTPIVAQQFNEDLIGSTGAMLKHFYESGQLWALLIGIVLGYTFKSAFSYG